MASFLLCLFSSTAGASEALTWPVYVELHTKDSSDLWVPVGDVAISNDRRTISIEIVPHGDLMLAEVAIHVVEDPNDFTAILDKKTKKPKVSRFDYRTDYMDDPGAPADHHLQVIDLGDYDFCWGVNPETCPPPYIIVHAELAQFDGEEWVRQPEGAYAMNAGIFDRFAPGEPILEGYPQFWGYVTYPLAKPEPGHFVDANVNGLTYVTVTQSGVTGDGGQFWYLPDERVAFSVGGLDLGDALGDRRVSPEDLFPGFDLENDRVLNLARLLQTLDSDGKPGQGAINISAEVEACLVSALAGNDPDPKVFFANDAAVGALIDATISACAGTVELVAVTKEQALENLNFGMQAGNLMKRNISKTPGMKSDKAKIEIMPVYVPAQRPDNTPVDVVYYKEDGSVLDTRKFAKPIVVTYLDEVEGTGSFDVFLAISRDDGDSWKRRNISKTADKSSLLGFPGKSEKPMLKVKDNLIFVAWTDKYCKGGRPGYAITVCPAEEPACEICRETDKGTVCTPDYPGDDGYWQDDLFGVGGPQRSVIYEPEDGGGEVPYSCVWSARAVIEPDGNIQWFKPERLTSGRRDAFQLFAGAGEDVAFGIVWQEDPKGLMPGEGDGPGDGWSGANTHSKTDIWYSYITLSDFGRVDEDYPRGGHGDNDDLVDFDSELAGRAKALVPMSLPVRISDNEMCSLENMDPDGGHGDHDFDEEGQGTHRYCGTLAGIGTAEAPGTNPLCAYTVEKANPKGEIHNACVTADGRLLDGNTGASRANLFLQPYKKTDGSKGAWAIIGYEESKGVGSPPEDEEGCGDEAVDPEDVDHEDRYKPDVGKNVIYHSFAFDNPEVVSGGGILNLPETDAAGDPIYLVNEDGSAFLDWEGKPVLAYENARRIRFVTQPKSKAGSSKTVLVALYRQGAEGSGKPADIFMRRAVAPGSGNPYAFGNFVPGAQNLSSVEPTELWQDPFDADKPVKMLRWGWSEANLADSSAENPYTDARAHRGALNGDDLIIAYTWTPNWGRRANDKYDLYVRRSFNGGQRWTTDPDDLESIEHNVVFRVPVIDEENQEVIWDDEVVTTVYPPDSLEPPRNVSNLRNYRISVLEPRLVKTPGTIESSYAEDVQDTDVYQLAWGLEFNQNGVDAGPNEPKQPLDIYYGRTLDKGQRYQSVVITPQGGNGKPEEGWSPLAKDHPEQGAAQIRQTPDGSRMYGIWLEESSEGSDIMFRRVDYRD
jgi:hypothetical protein